MTKLSVTFFFIVVARGRFTFPTRTPLPLWQFFMHAGVLIHSFIQFCVRLQCNFSEHSFIRYKRWFGANHIATNTIHIIMMVFFFFVFVGIMVASAFILYIYLCMPYLYATFLLKLFFSNVLKIQRKQQQN